MAVHIHIDKEPLVIKVPMKSYLVKFLTSKFGKNHKASRTSWIGITASNLLTESYSKPRRFRTKNFFIIRIPHTLCLKKGHFIDYSLFPEFQQTVERIFRDFMHEFVLINSKAESYGDILSSLKKFLNYYDIKEDELRLNSAYRHYLRAVEEKRNMTKKNRAKKKSF